MELLNVQVTKGGWTQVYDGTAAAVIAVSGCTGEVCQSTTAPDDALVGLPIDSMSVNRYIYNSTAGAPVYVKAYDDGLVIVNA